MADPTISHGWTTSEPDAGKDVDADNLNDHQITGFGAAVSAIVDPAVAAEATLARNADNLQSGTVADARIAATIARDSEVDTKVTTHAGATDPHGDRAAATTALGTHEAASDPHPGYLTPAEGDAAYPPLARTISAGTGLTGGGSLAANRTLAADFGAVAGKVTEGNDARLTDARTPTAHHASHEDGGTDEISIAGLSGTPAALTTHEAAGNPHPGYLTPAEGDAAYDAIGAAATAASGAATALSNHEGDTTAVHGIANTANLYAAGGTDVAVADGGTGASNAGGARTNLGLVIGTDVRAQGAGDPTRASLGLATSDSPEFAALNVGAATDTTITRTGAGDIAVEGNAVYRAGGTDVPVADGGTGASNVSGARTNLGLVIGTDVRAQGSGDPTRASLGLDTTDTPQLAGINVGHASDTTLARSSAGNLTVEGNLIYRAGGTDVPVADGGTGASDAATARTNLGAASVDIGRGTGLTTANTNVAAATGNALLDITTENDDADNWHQTATTAITGTVTKTASSLTLTGSGTAFLTELAAGSVISVPGTATEILAVRSIQSNTSLTLWAAPANTASGQTATRKREYFVVPEGQTGTYLIGMTVLVGFEATPTHLSGVSLSQQTNSVTASNIFTAYMTPNANSNGSATAYLRRSAMTEGDIYMLRAQNNNDAAVDCQAVFSATRVR